MEEAEIKVFRCKNEKCRAALGRIEGASLVVGTIKLTGNFRIKCDACECGSMFQSSNLRKTGRCVLMFAAA